MSEDTPDNMLIAEGMSLLRKREERAMLAAEILSLTESKNKRWWSRPFNPNTPIGLFIVGVAAFLGSACAHLASALGNEAITHLEVYLGAK